MKNQTTPTAAPTFQETERFLKELFAENDRKVAEHKRKLDEWLIEQRAETDRKLAEQRAETDRILSEKIAKIIADTESSVEEMFNRSDRIMQKEMKKVNQMIGGIANSNGEVAESYFINSFKKYPHFAGQAYQIIDINAHKRSSDLDLEDEYDLVLYNGTSVVIIEIKYNAKKDDVEQVLKKAETFRKLVPQYKDYALYLALAGLHVYKNTEQEAKKHGIAIIKQVGKHQVIIDEYLKAR